MMRPGLRAILPAMIACTLLSGAPGAAQQAGKKARFAPPVRIKAGDALLGERRLYPSPVLHDVDGDGRLDIVIGDLMGKVTVARRAATQETTFTAEKPFLDRDDRPLKFHNW